jgi:hypothetical protein
LVDVETLANQLAESDDWNAALRRYAAIHDDYFGKLHEILSWWTILVWTGGPEADSRRARVFPRMQQDATGFPIRPDRAHSALATNVRAAWCWVWNNPSDYAGKLRPVTHVHRRKTVVKPLRVDVLGVIVVSEADAPSCWKTLKPERTEWSRWKEARSHGSGRRPVHSGGSCGAFTELL